MERSVLKYLKNGYSIFRGCQSVNPMVIVVSAVQGAEEIYFTSRKLVATKKSLILS